MVQNLYSIHCFDFPSQAHAGRYGAMSDFASYLAHFVEVFRLQQISRDGRAFCGNFLRQAFVVHHARHEFRIVPNRRPQQVRAIPRRSGLIWVH